MALEGTFKDFHIADILQLIGLQRKTGTLTLEGEEETLTLTFQEGAVAWAQSTRSPWERRMAQVLVARGLLTPGQLQEALAAQKDSGKRLRDVLSEQGLLQKKDWNGALAREVEELVYRPFRWTAGRYRFVSERSVDLADGTIGPLGAEAVLMEGVRRVDEWPILLMKIPSTAMVFKVGSQTGKLNLKKQVETGEVRLLDLVDGKRTVQELVDRSGLGEFAAMQALASLVEGGAITAVGPMPRPVTVEAPPARVASNLMVRVSAKGTRWVARVAWGLALLLLLVNLALFRAEPLGLLPLSAARRASLDRVRSLRARAHLLELARGVERYVVTAGEVPAGLEVLGGPATPSRDPWGHPYLIRRAATPGVAGVSVVSGGPDGRVGTPDDIVVDDG